MGKPRDIADSAAVINALDGVTATGTELNILDGVTATTAELNILDGVTATGTELNILDGVTATTAELNYVDGVTSNIQTQLDNISVTSGSLTKTFVADEVATITLSGNVVSPVVGVTKEVAQTGTTNNSWDVNSTTENYTRLDSAPATTLDFSFSDNVDSTFTSANSVTVSSQDSNAKGAVLSSDGTKMFVCGDSNDVILEYALSTAYDLSTATYTQQFDVSSQTADPKSIFFKPDGTEFYLGGDDKVVQYSLSTAWDISTASHTATKTISGYGNTHFIAFNTDGTSLFFVGLTSTTYIWKFNLSTAWSISTASYNSGINISSTVANATARGLAINSDGTKFYVATTSNNIKQFSTSTAYNVSGLSFDNKTSQTLNSGVFGIFFPSDFSRLYVTTSTVVYEYTNAITGLTLGTGSFASADVGKTIEANSGVFVLTSTAGAISETTAPTSYAQVASGSWEMYGVVYNTTDGDLQLSGGLLNERDISTASYNRAYDVSARGSTLVGVTFKPDGTKMYVTFDSNNDVVQFDLSTAWDISTASYTTYAGLGGQDSIPAGIIFNNDGTKFYMLGYSSNTVYEYSLTTAYAINTISLERTFSVSTYTTQPYDIKFNSDGTKMFVTDNSSIRILEYALSTAFRVDTATYTRVFSLSSQMTNAYGLAFNSDGTTVYVSEPGDIFQYTLTTGFDLSTASYSNKTKNISSNVSTPTALFLKPDGQNIFIADYSGTDVNDYSIGTEAVLTGYHAVHTTNSTDSTYWTDINSMTADEAAGDGSVYYAVSTDDRATWKIADNTDGIRSIVRNNSGTWQYNSNGTYASTTWANATTNTELNALQEAMEGATLVNGYQISAASYDSTTFSWNTGPASARGADFNSDGTKLFLVAPNTDLVYEYDLSSAYDVSTMSDSGTSFSVSSQSLNAYSVKFKSDGSKMYVGDADNKKVLQYSLSTAFDLSTASYDSVSFNTGTQVTASFGFTGLLFSPDGTKMYAANNAGGSTSAVYQYTLSTAWDVSTVSYASKSLTVGGLVPNPYDMKFNSDGTKFFITGNSNDKVQQYSLSTAYDISTGTSDSVEFSFASQATNPYGLLFNNNGTKMYTLDTDSIYQYSTSTTSYPNLMNKTQLDAVSDANHFTLGNDLDLAIVFNLTSGSTVPSSDGVSINYDANVLNKGAILGTDYDYDAPAQNKVRITALTGNNLKIRVV